MMTLNEALKELEENGYTFKKKTLLEESLEYLRENGYMITEADEEEDEGGDYEDSDDDENISDKGEDHSKVSEDDLKDDIADVVKELRGIDDYAEFVNYLQNDLKGYQLDLIRQIVGNGKFARDTELKKGAIPVWKLHPTQSEIDIASSLAYPLGCSDKGDKGANGLPAVLDSKNSGSAVTINVPLIVYKHTDGNYYIIDGHHRWSQVALCNRKAFITIYLLKQAAEGNESPVDVLRDFQLVIKAETGTVKVATVKKGNNIFDKTPDYLAKYVNDNMTDYAVEQWNKSETYAEDNKTKEQIAEIIKNNGAAMKSKNMPADGAPERKYMPQTDAKTVQMAAKGMTDV